MSSSSADSGCFSESVFSVVSGTEAAVSGSTSGLSFAGLIPEFVGETERGLWLTGGDDACGMLQKD